MRLVQWVLTSRYTTCFPIAVPWLSHVVVLSPPQNKGTRIATEATRSWLLLLQSLSSIVSQTSSVVRSQGLGYTALLINSMRNGYGDDSRRSWGNLDTAHDSQVVSTVGPVHILDGTLPGGGAVGWERTSYPGASWT